MAISLPNHSVLSPLRPSVSLTSSKPTTTKPSKSLALCFPSARHFHSQAHLRNPVLGFPRTRSFAVPKTSTTRFAASAVRFPTFPSLLDELIYYSRVLAEFGLNLEELLINILTRIKLNPWWCLMFVQVNLGMGEGNFWISI